MKPMVSKTFMKAMSVLAYTFLMLFAGTCAVMSIGCFFLSIVESDFMHLVGCAAFGAAAWFIWSLRKSA